MNQLAIDIALFIGLGIPAFIIQIIGWCVVEEGGEESNRGMKAWLYFAGVCIIATGLALLYYVLHPFFERLS